MQHDLAALAVSFIVGIAMFAAYCHVSKNVAKKDRPRLFMFAMCVPVVVMTSLLTTNPLPALVALTQAAWPSGPSG